MSGGAGEVVMATVGLIANFSAGNIRDEHGDADCVLVGLNEQSIGMNHQATADQFAIISAGVLIMPKSKKAWTNRVVPDCGLIVCLLSDKRTFAVGTVERNHPLIALNQIF